jgi:hypothetical protein
MDACFSFLLEADGTSILVGNHPVRAETVFVAPYLAAQVLDRFLVAANPRLVVPIHWDDFMRPLSEPVRAMLITAPQGLGSYFPPVGRLNLQLFEERVRAVLPGTRVRIPEMFRQESISAS